MRDVSYERATKPVAGERGCDMSAILPRYLAKGVRSALIDNRTQLVLAYVLRKRACFTMQIANDLRLDPVDVKAILCRLIKEGLIERDESNHGIPGGIYRPTARGAFLVRALRRASVPA